jgi:hypothetical protein
MFELNIIAKCANCKHCHKNRITEDYSCSKKRWCNNSPIHMPLCKEWKPSPQDMELWIRLNSN